MNELMISDKIHHLPGHPPFMLARDLAEMYQTTTKRIAEQVRRNPRRFPEEFCFRLSKDDASKCGVIQATEAKGMLAFTHDGANALAGVLKTPIADERSVLIAKAFTKLEQGQRPLAGPTTLRLLPVRGLLLPIISHPEAGEGVLAGPLERSLGKPRGYVRHAVEREPSLQRHYVLLAGATLQPVKGFGRLKSTVNVTAMLRLDGIKQFAMLGYAGGDGQDLVLAVHRIQTGQLALA